MKAAGKKALNVIFWLILALIVFFTLLLILSAFNLGVRAYVISSGSMSPAIDAGSIVFVRTSDNYAVGDIVTYKTSGDKPTTHRVFEIKDEGGEITYITKGDANDDPDTNPVYQDDILGRVVFHIPLVGYVTAFFRTKLGIIVIIIFIAAALIYLILFSSGSRQDKEDNGTRAMD